MREPQLDAGPVQPGPSAAPLASVIRRDFGLRVETFVRCPYRFESECWIADERWFIKGVAFR